MVEERMKRTELPAAQQSVLFSEQIRSYLDSKCPTEPDGMYKSWRIYDKDTAVDGEYPWLKGMMTRPRPSVPYIHISNDKELYEGPLPANVEEALTLLKKYGG